MNTTYWEYFYKNGTWLRVALISLLMAGPIPLCLSAPLTSPGAQAAPSATSPSFDCAKAKSSIESLICKNPELAQLDSSMADAYREAAKRVKPKEVAKLRQEQRRWIQQTRSLCLDATCLKQVYTDRIYILDKTETTLANITICYPLKNWISNRCTKISIYRNPNEQLAFFKESIKYHNPPEHIIGCSMLIQVPLGGTSNNQIFAGYCTLQNGLEIIMENDIMIGVPTIVPDNNHPKDLNRLIEFVGNPDSIIDSQGEL